jgi:glycosyltransferase involved in cell wall biosynthesis
MYIKRELLTRIGPFDPAFDMAFEDVDYCLRAREAGYRTMYCPGATLIHLEGYTRGERKEAREVRSQEYFWNTWRAHFDGRRLVGSRDRPRVIYVLQDTGIAGGHKVVFEHLNGLAARGYEAELYSLAHSPKWFRLNVPVRTFSDYRALRADLSQQDAIKVATWWETSEVVWKASLQRGAAAYLVQDIETSYYRPEEHKERARVIASYRKEFHYLTDASWTRQQLAAHGADACVVSPGIDVSTFKLLSVERSRDVVLSIGRSHPLKNIDFLLRAFPRLRSQASLQLFGIEPSIGKRLTSRYVVNPSDQDIAVLYNRATVFVLPSRHEGYALPILEAMACGCPVICTNANGNMDFCRDGENCLIVPTDDDARLAELLDQLLGSPELQEKLRAGGLATVQKYTWERALDVLDNFYQGVARDRSRYHKPLPALTAAESLAVSASTVVTAVTQAPGLMNGSATGSAGQIATAP